VSEETASGTRGQHWDSQSVGTHLNQGPPEYEAGVVPTGPQCSQVI
jgi:hypothetical protein